MKHFMRQKYLKSFTLTFYTLSASLRSQHNGYTSLPAVSHFTATPPTIECALGCEENYNKHDWKCGLSVLVNFIIKLVGAFENKITKICGKQFELYGIIYPKIADACLVFKVNMNDNIRY